MPGNAVLKIEHDTQAIYYLCVLNLGYQIVCSTISFWSCGRCTLYTSMHFSLHVDCSGEQTDKTKWERWTGDDVCVYKHKKNGGESQKCFQMSPKWEICHICLWWNTTTLCCECCSMSEQLNLSWCNLSHRNFGHGTVSQSDSLQMWSISLGKKTTAIK